MTDWWSADPVATVPPGGDNWWHNDPAAGASPSIAADIGKSALSGVGQGVVGLPGIPGNLVSLGKGVGNWINQKLYSSEQIQKFEANREKIAKTPPTSSEVIGAAERATGHQFYQPQTTAGEYARTIGEFAPNVIGGPGSAAGKIATRVVAPAVASETGGQLTKGTAAEPWARLAGAAIGAGPQAVRDIRNTVKKPEINAPSLEELHDAASQAYKEARNYGIEIKRHPVARLADDILSDLHNNGFRKLDAPSSWAKIEELKNPAGRYVTLDDIESVRRALGKASPMNGMEKEVGRRGIEAIDKYVSSLARNRGHIAVNPQFADQVASAIQEGRSNWAAMKRGETIEGKLDAANQQTGRAGSGANINNATRQQISQVLRSPKLRRGFSTEELDAMRQLVMGTKAGNLARKVGKLSPEGIVSGALGIELGHLASGNLAHGLLVPALGKVAKIFGDRSTAKQAERLSQMVRARSPLGRTLPQPLPPPPVSVSPYVGTGLLGQSSAQERGQGHAAGGRTDGGPADAISQDQDNPVDSGSLYSDPRFQSLLQAQGPERRQSRLDIAKQGAGNVAESLLPLSSLRYPDTPQSRQAYDAALQGGPGKIPPVPGSPRFDPATGLALDVGSGLLPVGKAAVALKGAAAMLPGAKVAGEIAGNLLENQTNALSKTERFNWPVTTSYGKTIDMPVSVNPSRSMIQRELAQAPHGDVRALKAPNGDVYLWPANEAMHVDIADTFDLPFKTRQELQKASYLFNKADVDKLGRFTNFDDLVSKLGMSADQPLARNVLARGRTGRPIQTKPLPIGNENAILEAGAKLNEPSPSVTAYHGSPEYYNNLRNSHGPEFSNAAIIDHEGNVLHSPERQSIGGPMLRVNQDGSVTRGILAYHGSPHDFDRFDLSKIGTGEGAQAYGHGLYFAENEGVARDYKKTLTGMRNSAAQRALDASGGDVDAAIASIRAKINNLRELPNAGGNAYKRDRMVNIEEEKLAELNAFKTSGNLSPGRLYQVSIKADPEHFLDWDKPLSEQNPKIQEVATKAGLKPSTEVDPSLSWLSRSMGLEPAKKAPTGADLIRHLSGSSGSGLFDPETVDPVAATNHLRSAGIPGIKYLDQGSRAGGEGTRNYVVFDDKLIDILKKYGLAGLVAGGAYHYQDNDMPKGRARGGRVPGELTESNKSTHEEVGYVSVSPRKKQKCELCWKFIPDGPACRKVQSPIAAGGWCRRFSKVRP